MYVIGFRNALRTSICREAQVALGGSQHHGTRSLTYPGQSLLPVLDGHFHYHFLSNSYYHLLIQWR